MLAGIPTVVYGFFALTLPQPRSCIELWPAGTKPEFQNLLVAGIAMGIMIVPTVASLSEDAMSAVPHSLREGAYALASTKMQVATRVVVPAALSGIVAAFVLGRLPRARRDDDRHDRRRPEDRRHRRATRPRAPRR